MVGFFILKIRNKIFILSILLVFLLSISFVSASAADDNLTITDDSSNVGMDSYSSSNVLSSDGSNTTIVINQRNYKMYFDDSNTLKTGFNESVLTFDGTFTDKGVFTINSDNTKITGRNTLFNNTVFNIKANGVMLTNLNFVLNESFKNNNFAGIYVSGDNVTVYNVNLDYNTPENTDAIGIYSHENTGFRLINSTVNLEGHAFKNGHDYSVLLLYSDDALVSGNTINSTLPLREVDWSQGIYGGVGMDKVASFAAGNSKNLKLSGNTIYSDVNYGEYADNKYPTLSSVLIYACDNSTVNDNSIQIEDLYTRKNQANYLYALDIYRLNDLTAVGNNIDVFTYGGKEYLGTAYPIQVTGPAYNIKIAYNYLHSVSNGPNIGIYSQNYYGSTQIDIISNFINITGKASTHQWALVAGIEVQDSDDTIFNNTIIVDTVGGYKSGDRIYGISYSQNTGGNHKYNIKYNDVTVPGPIAISLNQGLSSSTSDTNVMYNILRTGIGEGGDKAVSIGGNGVNNVIRYNTNGQNTIRHMSDRDVPAWLINYFNGNGNGIGVDLSWLNTGEDTGKGIGTGEGQGNGIIKNNNVNGNNIHISKSTSPKGDANSTHYTYGESGVSIASASSSAGSGQGSATSSQESPKAYEVTKQIKNPTEINPIRFIVVILLVLFLLILGYSKKRKTEEEY